MVSTEVAFDAGGEGGAVLRAALALSMATGRAVALTGLRTAAEKPGLLRQHVRAIEVARSVCDGVVEGCAIGSRALRFAPGPLRTGRIELALGSNVSAVLIAQMLVPALMTAAEPSTLVLHGGTHVPDAPVFEQFATSWLPLVARTGAGLATRLVSHGFFPAGHGRMEVEVAPARVLRPLVHRDRGDLRSVGAEALIAGLPREIAERAVTCAGKVLASDSSRIVELADRHGPGMALVLTATFEHGCEVTGIAGRVGLPAHNIGEQAGRRLAGVIAGSAATGPYLAAQLLVPLALAGGAVTTVKPTDELKALVALAQVFGLATSLAATDGCHLVEARTAS